MDEDRYDRQRRIWGLAGQERLQQAKVVIAGAGGVGSEIIKNLALLGFGTLVIIDLDLIELSNLNRQLLFRKADIGKYKAEIAAIQAKLLNENIQIISYNKKLQDLPNKIFSDADIFVSALDNIPARIFLNQKAVLLKIPMVDGGSEGFFGHVQVVLPHTTPCLLCHDIWSRTEEKFKCTYSVLPRTPEDCVLEGRDKFYAEFNRLPNAAEMVDIEKVYQYAMTHAKNFNIAGVSYQLVRDWMKGTVAALITTNAVIGAVMTNEILKIILKEILTKELELNTIAYYQYNGLTEAGWSIPLERDEQCPVCGLQRVEIETLPTIPLMQFVHHLETRLTFELVAPLLVKEGILLYRDPSFLKAGSISSKELERLKEIEMQPVKDFINDGDTLFLKDEILGIELWVTVKYQVAE